MLYNLLYPLSVDYSILNIFKYITSAPHGRL